MKLPTLNELLQNQNFIGLGIAGNQAEHLDQAGEADDFKEIITQGNAPKGIFPWFVNDSNNFLAENPLSHHFLYHNGESFLQPEPEIALVVKFDYSKHNDQVIDDLSVLGFTTFNDCSRRVIEPKISLKKNWGLCSQGIAEHIMPIDDFERPGGIIDSYRLGCYLLRGGKLIQYGKDTAVTDYCYFNQTLIDWLIHQINTQRDQGPLEPINNMLSNGKPRFGLIGIGASCYSDFGNSEQRYLRAGDEVIVVAYDSNKLIQNEVEELLESTSTSTPSLLILRQIVRSKNTQSS
jgi:hypothetical protein